MVYKPSILESPLPPMAATHELSWTLNFHECTGDSKLSEPNLLSVVLDSSSKSMKIKQARKLQATLVRNYDWLTYLLTRVKSRDASASKNATLWSFPEAP